MPDEEEFGFGEEEGGGEAGAGDAAEPSGGGGLKRFLSGAVLRILLFVAAGIGVIIISVITSSIVAGGSEAEGPDPVARGVPLDTKPPAWAGYDLDEIMVATADRDSSHFIKLKISLAYEGGNMGLQTELTERRRQIRDLIIGTLNSKTKEALHSWQQKEDFKSELVKRINALLQYGEIKDIYYMDVMIN